MDINNHVNPRVYVVGLPGSGRTRMAHHIAAALKASGCVPVLLDGVVKQQDGEIPVPLPFARFGEVVIETAEVDRFRNQALDDLASQIDHGRNTQL